MSEKQIKCVIVGDSFVGKSYLLISYLTKSFPIWYDNSPFEHYSTSVTVDGQAVAIKICDTPGSEDYDRLRMMSFINADVFIICFSVVIPKSFDNVKDRWLYMLRHHCPSVPVILVGAQIDLRNDQNTIEKLMTNNSKPITHQDGLRMAELIGAEKYLECSAFTRYGLDEIFVKIAQCGKKTMEEPAKEVKSSCVMI